MRKLLIFLLVGCLLGLMVPPAAAQTPANNSPAQLRRLMQQSRSDTNQVQLLLQLSSFYLDEAPARNHPLDSALLLARQAAELSQRLHFVRGSDAALYTTGQVFAKRQATGSVLALLKAASDSTRIKLLLALGQEKLGAASSSAAADSALYFFHQAEQRSATPALRQWHDESLFQIGTYYVQRDDLPRGKSYFMQVIEADRRAKDKASEGQAWFRLGSSFPPFSRNKYQAEKLSYFGQARALAHQSHDSKMETLSLQQIAFIHHYQGNREQAKRELLEVLAIQKATKDKETYVAYDALAAIASSMGDFAQALSYQLQCISSMEASGDKNDLDHAYFLLGTVYQTLRQHDKAVEALEKSLAFSHAKGQRILTVELVSVMVTSLIAEGKAAEALRFTQRIASEQPVTLPRDKMFMAAAWAACYRALHQNEQAEKYLLQGVALGKEVDMHDALRATYLISRFYLATKQYRKARPFLEQLLATPKGILPANVLQYTHYASFKVDSAAGNYLAAIAHFRRSKDLNDSIYTVAKSQQLTQLQVQYETQKKEQDILLLTEKARHQTARAQRQQSELERAQMTRNATLGGSVLLLLLLGTGYNRYRLKQRSNQLLEAQQAEINRQNVSLQHLLTEKDWMLKEIHHRVKNNLEVISSLLETQSDYLHDPSALAALREGQNRVHAMALIHQKLYQSHSLAVVNMAAYIREIAEHLVESFDCQDTVQLHLNLAPVELEVTLATPLGLIINEALTNALKYAFPRSRSGTISITLAETDAQHFQLVIEDDGAGFPAGFHIEDGLTMGLTIMRGLSGQLDGHLRITQTPGVQVSLNFEAATSAMPARVG